MRSRRQAHIRTFAPACPSRPTPSHLRDERRRALPGVHTRSDDDHTARRHGAVAQQGRRDAKETLPRNAPHAAAATDTAAAAGRKIPELRLCELLLLLCQRRDAKAGWAPLERAGRHGLRDREHVHTPLLRSPAARGGAGDVAHA